MTPRGMRRTAAARAWVTIFITHRVAHQSVKNPRQRGHYHRHRRARITPKQGRSPATRVQLRHGGHTNKAITAQSSCMSRSRLQDTRRGQPCMHKARRRARRGAAAQIYCDSCCAGHTGRTQPAAPGDGLFGFSKQTDEIRQRAPLRSSGKDPPCRARRDPCGHSRRVSSRGVGVQSRIRVGARDKTANARGAEPLDPPPLHPGAGRSSEAPTRRVAPAAGPVPAPKDQRLGVPKADRQAGG